MNAMRHRRIQESARRSLRGNPDDTTSSPVSTPSFPAVLTEYMKWTNMDTDCQHIAWEVAHWQQDLDRNDRRTLAGLVWLSLCSADCGSTRFPVSGHPGRSYLKKLLQTPASRRQDVDALIADMQALVCSDKVSSVIGGPGSFKPLILDTPYLYQQKFFQMELQLAQHLIRLGRHGHAPAPAALMDACMPRDQGFAFAFSEAQKTAMVTSCSAGITMISGGPGTGKTSIIAGILDLLHQRGQDMSRVALTAPTGRASQHMTEAIGSDMQNTSDCPPTATLHRLLGFQPYTGRFRHHHNHPLPFDVVIVDEASMVDLRMMVHLASCLKNGTRLILIGDSEQLPSVETGAVFRELITYGREHPGHAPWCVIPLEENFRLKTGGKHRAPLDEFLRSIRRPQPEACLPGKAALPKIDGIHQLAFHTSQWLAAPMTAAMRAQMLLAWLQHTVLFDPHVSGLAHVVFALDSRGALHDADMAEIQKCFERISNSRILCATRLHDTGCHGINVQMHKHFTHHTGYQGHAGFLPGEPVIMHKNDYGKDLFNGDTGMVVQVQKGSGPPYPAVVFPRPQACLIHPLAALRGQISPAWAITVHKSQGSEYDQVMLVLPDRDMPVLSKELIYTGVSRARTILTLAGTERVLAAALARTATRHSGIGDRLRQITPA